MRTEYIFQVPKQYAFKMVAIKFCTFVESRGTVLPRIHQLQDLFNVFDQQSAFFLQLGTLSSTGCLCLICIWYTINFRYEHISTMRWTRFTIPTNPTISWNLLVESERTHDRAGGDKRVDRTLALDTKERKHDTLSRIVFHVPLSRFAFRIPALCLFLSCNRRLGMVNAMRHIGFVQRTQRLSNRSLIFRWTLPLSCSLLNTFSDRSPCFVA